MRAPLDWRFLLVIFILALIGASYFLDAGLYRPVQGNAPVTQNVPTSASRASAESGIIWTSTRDLDAAENALRHFRKHGHEFGFTTVDEYVAAATRFLKDPPSGTQTKKQKDGDTVRFRASTGEFAVMNRRGVPRTYFRLDPAIHGFPDNQAYFDAQ